MIRTIVALLVLLLGGVTPAYAEGGTMTADGISVTLDVGPVVFDGPGCTRVPWTVTYSKPDDFWLGVRWQLRQRGSNETSFDEVNMYSGSAGTVTKTTCVSADKHLPSGGNYVLTAQIGEDGSASGDILASLPPVEIPTYTSRTRITRLRFHSNPAGNPYVRGRVRARTSSGERIGASGTIEIYVRRHGIWARVGSLLGFDLDSQGWFEHTFLFSNVRRGEKIQARLVGCHWCTDARRVTVVQR